MNFNGKSHAASPLPCLLYFLRFCCIIYSAAAKFCRIASLFSPLFLADIFKLFAPTSVSDLCWNKGSWNKKYNTNPLSLALHPLPPPSHSHCSSCPPFWRRALRQTSLLRQYVSVFLSALTFAACCVSLSFCAYPVIIVSAPKRVFNHERAKKVHIFFINTYMIIATIKNSVIIRDIDRKFAIGNSEYLTNLK